MTDNIVNKKFFCIYIENLVTVQFHLAVLKYLTAWSCILYTTLSNREMKNELQGHVYGHLKVWLSRETQHASRFNQIRFRRK